MDSEKKIKLEELPNEGSSRLKVTRPKRRRRPIIPPRVQDLQGKTLHRRVMSMSRKWYFDHEERQWGWLIFVVVVIFLPVFYPYNEVNETFRPRSYYYGRPRGYYFLSTVVYLVVRYPIVLICLTPFLFRLKSSTDFWFEVSFDGISTVRSAHLDATEMPQRVFIKWDEMVKVTRVKRGEEDALVIHSPDGPVAELFWEIDEQKKRALKVLLNGMVPAEHALRSYLEKEMA